jgi:hypothetical protein
MSYYEEGPLTLLCTNLLRAKDRVHTGRPGDPNWLVYFIYRRRAVPKAAVFKLQPLKRVQSRRRGQSFSTFNTLSFRDKGPSIHLLLWALVRGRELLYQE